MKAPTTEEIRAGYDAITADGPGAEITAELSILVLRNPQLRDTIHRQMRAASALFGASPTSADMQAVLSGALIYGLHLGLHIGERRASDGER